MKRRNPIDWPALVMVLPFVLILVTLVVVPVGIAIGNSFTNMKFIGMPAEFAGLRQYRRVLTDPLFWNSLGRSGQWILGNALLQTIVAFFFALLLSRRSKNLGLQLAVLLPWIIPTVAVAVIGTWLTNSSYGLLPYVTNLLGIANESWNAFGSADRAMGSLIILNSWHWFPFFFVVILGALTTVPDELYEAAAIDGANAWHKFSRITLPLISRILGIVGLVGTLWSFNIYDTIFLVTQGGPANATFTAPMYVYETAFNAFNMAKSSAASVILMIFMMLFAVFFYNVAVRRAYHPR
jgi:multiple sugar transport system permease protein